MEALLKIVLLLALKHIAAAMATPPYFVNSWCSTSNYTNGSSYQSKLDYVLTSISNNIDVDVTDGFYNASSGQAPEVVYGLAWCMAYTTVDQCRSCLQNATSRIRIDCPNQLLARGTYPDCILRYSNESMFGVVADGYRAMVWAANPPDDPAAFNSSLLTLLNTIKGEAASGDSLRKYAAGNQSWEFGKTIYAISQCSPDLSMLQCISCLETLAQSIPYCCSNQLSADFYTDSCVIKYSTARYYADPPTILTASSPTRATAPEIAPTASPVVLPNTDLHTSFVEPEIIEPEALRLKFDTIRAATDNFSEEKKLGQGGFGSVYRCVLPDGRDMAIKRLSARSPQADMDFRNEAILLAKLQHKNLVKLVGYCVEYNERLLAYEYCPNASLDRFLFDSTKRLLLNWATRRKIIEGIARGMVYLHVDSRLKIIHRDLKASNVLLDEDMNPKIADFGFARLFQRDQTHGNTNRIVGTFGYMPPEYVVRGKFSLESDVFGFGVLILEIVSGRGNDYEESSDGGALNLISYVWGNWREGTWMHVVDPYLIVGPDNQNDIMRCIHIGLLCVQESAYKRPSIESVVLMLSSHSVALPKIRSPAFLFDNKRGEAKPQFSSSHEEASISDVSAR